MKLLLKISFLLVVGVGIVALCLELSWRHYVNFGGKRNRLVCDLVCTDGLRLTDVEIVFRAAHGFRIIPLSGMAGGQPDRTIQKEYRIRSDAPGSFVCEWPRLYLRLDHVKIGSRVFQPNHPRATTTGWWESEQPKYFDDGSRDWNENTTGDYAARIEVDLRNNCFYVERLSEKKKEPNQALLPTTMSVTSRACARVAPDTVAADL